jgi:hypothetical protein
MSKAPNKLHVEGVNDINVISALLKRHGLDTERGYRHLDIKASGSVEELLAIMPDVITAASDRPVGFVFDIDIEIKNRWAAVCGSLQKAGVTPPPNCPPIGYLDKITDYQCRFGVWLMPDCATDSLKLENLCQSLIPNDDPLWPVAKISVSEVIRILGEANSAIIDEDKRWKTFRDVDRIKAEIHTWLAWQHKPGCQLGEAVNAHILRHDSQESIAFLRWLKDLYGFQQLVGI